MSLHKNLIVWQKAIDLSIYVYKLTKKFPKSETYSLCNQIQRAAVSVPSNIAEGRSRQTKKEYVQFLYIALGSLAETETQLHISRKLKYLTDKEHSVATDQIVEISKMINALIKKMRPTT